MTAVLTPARMAEIHARAFTMPRPWTMAEIAAAMSDPLGIVVTDSLGFLLGRVVAGEAEIMTLAVDPEGRRQGVGQRLVSGLVTQAQQRGAETVFLEVAQNNRAACGLYAKCGFVPRGRRRNYYRDATGQPIDALILVRQIPAAGGTIERLFRPEN